MADPELEAIRQQRMQQMQGSNDQQKAMQEQRQAQEEMKNSMLSQLLDQDARALNTLKLSKPEKAQMVEGMIIRMAQMRQIGDKLDDASLVKLLENLNQQMPRSNSTVKFDRRRAALDSDEDDDDYGI
uniref:Programmed cell death protein 5 n=1 Tax=Anopheles funestus TaxID=62324 RepID=A0A7M4YF41_ANOFN